MSELGSVTTDSKVKSISEELTLNSDVRNQIEARHKSKSKVSNYSMSVDGNNSPNFLEEVKCKYSNEEIKGKLLKKLVTKFSSNMVLIQSENFWLKIFPSNDVH